MDERLGMSETKNLKKKNGRAAINIITTYH